jgi:glutamine amidotransferase
MSRSVAIVDYGAGNILNVLRAFVGQGIDAELVSEPQKLRTYSHLVLPGVGSFAYGMEHLAKRKLEDEIVTFAQSGKPVLGICLGMQLLAQQGFENGITRGLRLIEGDIVHLRDHDVGNHSSRIPHTGWSPLVWRVDGESFLFPELRAAYFNHSYYLTNALEAEIVATASFGGAGIPAAIRSGSIFATQFHPEKSGEAGLRLLKAWSVER